MNEIILLGGPLDSRQRRLTKAPPEFVWAWSSNGGKDAQLKLYQEPGEERYLYRHEDAKSSGGLMRRTYLYVGHRMALCCGCYVAKGPQDWVCLICGEELTGAKR